MAKVKITGHASGTGILTVTAPNTSTDRTITLPDATGTLLNSDGSGASLTALNATQLTSGTVPTARLGSGTASSSTYLRGDNSWATVTSVGGATGADFNDDVKVRLGTGNDLEIYHDGTDSIIYDASDVKILSNSNIFLGRQEGGGATMLKAVVDGTVELYHDNTKKLETIAGGCRIPSGGLLFGSDTAAANALDDYEEGTYTPTFLDSSGAAMTGTLSNALYTKVGRLVHVMVYYVVSDAQNGALNTMSLPFTQTSGRGAASVVTYNCPAANVENACYINSGSKVAFWNIRNDATSLTMTVDNGSELIIAATYMANV